MSQEARLQQEKFKKSSVQALLDNRGKPADEVMIVVNARDRCSVNVHALQAASALLNHPAFAESSLSCDDVLKHAELKPLALAYVKTLWKKRKSGEKAKVEEAPGASALGQGVPAVVTEVA